MSCVDVPLLQTKTRRRNPQGVNIILELENTFWCPFWSQIDQLNISCKKVLSLQRYMPGTHWYEQLAHCSWFFQNLALFWPVFDVDGFQYPAISTYRFCVAIFFPTVTFEIPGRLKLYQWGPRTTSRHYQRATAPSISIYTLMGLTLPIVTQMPLSFNNI